MKKIKKTFLGGAILFIGAAQLLLCLIIAGSLYLDYSIANNYISDLGMADSPVALLFNISIILFGLSVIYTAVQCWQKQNQFAFTLLLTGLGFVGVGIFTGDFALAHVIFALILLIFGSMTMIASIVINKTLFGYFSVALGVFSFIATFLFLSNLTLGIGIGGMERLAFYSILIWMAGVSGRGTMV
ncbi:DUF998 domain-containing protein [Patescibacteria group bacterium]|nr:DUF998 domain-containing protein [Patescibacteria group bacterium]MBU1683486.1 DUF998 domain-containing protein [Patescibacteria group bacterium]MBU1935056.1 DUF998 domain-containing protein [Patescibacteria group bacterium]